MPWVRKPAQPVPKFVVPARLPPLPTRSPGINAVPVTPPVAPPCPPLASSGEQLPVATSIADLKDAGGVGALSTAVIAPKEGDINLPAGTPVILVLKHLRDTETYKKLIGVVKIAWVVFTGFVGYKIIDHGSLWGMDWTPVWRGAIDAALLSVLAAYGISLKAKFNDPSSSASLQGSAKADAAAMTKGTP